MSLGTAGPGWYDNPNDPAHQLYWDGRAWNGQSREKPPPLPDPERRAILAQRIAEQAGHGYRVESQMEFQAIMVRGHRTNHVLHLILSVLTLGLWLIVWFAVAAFGGEKREMIVVDEYGN